MPNKLLTTEGIYTKGIIIPKIRNGNEHSWFVFPIRVNKKIRDKVITKLNRLNIGSKAYFYPCIHLQPFYIDTFGYKEGDFPVAEDLSRTTLILPFYIGIKEKEIKTVANSLRNILRKV